ncbi:biotin-dependent carboxyltransferase family protein [Pseudoalteromonas sp. SG43-7]|uniref:5-oxoprolinase subunit C family protein n=1 Tax=Pseudoalteromonas sp. SG43-7 TaxID=2760966 RepID=UPI001601C59F|nr:biotin-dependent carboxyltransferase family protein [Pseudoalteromonas sp. SG43-7]MBB1423459.1 biotin-dependent carboxyltransferase family protein [Pseudoalteromonas sp. SG43-7]
MITVIKPGMQMTIQDLGRHGYRHLGIAQSGALDPYAMIIANRLVGNDDNQSVIEITLGLAQLQFQCATVIALHGADMQAKLDGVSIYPGWSYPVEQGQTLTFATARQGFRSYLAIKGGIDCHAVMNSTATDIAAGFGGLTGAPLQANDQVPITPFDGNWPQRGAIAPAKRSVIRVHSSPHQQLLSQQFSDFFAQTKWQVSPQSNRMGVRLSTEHNQLMHTHSLPSLAVSPGSIQLTPSGEPIVLLNDGQTTGGYPLLGTIISADQHQFAQLKPGDFVIFEFVNLAAANTAQRKLDAHLQQLTIALKNLSIR